MMLVIVVALLFRLLGIQYISCLKFVSEFETAWLHKTEWDEEIDSKTDQRVASIIAKVSLDVVQLIPLLIAFHINDVMIRLWSPWFSSEWKQLSYASVGHGGEDFYGTCRKSPFIYLHWLHPAKWSRVPCLTTIPDFLFSDESCLTKVTFFL